MTPLGTMSLATDTKRNLDPEQIHQIWLLLIKLLKDQAHLANGSDPSTTSVGLQSLCMQLKSATCNENSQSIIEQAIKEGFLRTNKCSSNGLTNGIDSAATTLELDSELLESKAWLVNVPLEETPRSETVSEGGGQHDWYCFECHRGEHEANKRFLQCQHCWRVYHSECVQKAYEFIVNLEPDDSQANNSTSEVIRARNFICPVCVLSKKYAINSVESRQFSQTEFNEILGYTYQRFKSKSSPISRCLQRIKELQHTPLSASWSELLHKLSSSVQPGSTAATNGNTTTSGNLNELATKLALQYLSYKTIDLADIEAKLDASHYQSIGEFFGDCLTVKHMMEVVAVVNEPEGQYRRRIRDTLVRMLDACRYDLTQMLICVDCYRNSNRRTVDKYWFCRPCKPPHLLVFAKQKGYCYWPAKVIYPRYVTDLNSFEQYDVRFFGANHERSIIDNTNIKDINSSFSELAIIRPNSSLERALSELRTHRELLEKFELGIEEDIVLDCVPDESTQSIQRKRNKPSRRSTCSSQTEDEGLADSQSNSSSSGPGKEKTVKGRARKRSFMGSDSGNGLISSEEECDSANKHIINKVSTKSTIVTNKDAEIASDSTTDVDEFALEFEETSSNITVKEESINQISPLSQKRGRGRPRKYFSVEGVTCQPHIKPATTNTAKQTHDNGNARLSTPIRRERKSKVVYSPQSGKIVKNIDKSSPVPPKVSTRGPKPKWTSPELNSPTHTSMTTTGETISPVKRTVIGQTRRGRSSSSIYSSTIVQKSITSPVSKKKLISTTSSANEKSNIKSDNTSIVKTSKLERSSEKKRNLEHQRALIREAKRKLKLKKQLVQSQKAIVHRHIPPVTATKSAAVPIAATSLANNSITSSIAEPQSSTGKTPFVSKPILAQNSLAVSSVSSNATYSHISNGGSGIYSKKNDHFNSVLIPSIKSEPDPYFASNILRPLINEEEPFQHSVNNFPLQNPENGIESNSVSVEYCQTNDQITSRAVGEEMDESDLYEPEQLEQQINDYLAYEEEKRKVHSFQQSYPPQYQTSLIAGEQHQVAPYMAAKQEASEHSLFPTGQRSELFLNELANPIVMQHPQMFQAVTSPVSNSNLLFEKIPPQKYFDYPSSCIYSPTKKNQNLVNNYLHQLSTSSIDGGYRNDFLGQMVLCKDKLSAEPEEPVCRKRGRPSKNATDDLLTIGKARSIVEKSYLQESSCDRACLNKNIKSFKKFRDFVENQNRQEFARLKREIDQLKKENSHLKNENSAMKQELDEQRELSKRFDPQRLKQIEEKHRQEISEIKRKLWCVCCQAEASYFCCLNNNYCSPECQQRHWPEHTHKCVRFPKRSTTTD